MASRRNHKITSIGPGFTSIKPSRKRKTQVLKMESVPESLKRVTGPSNSPSEMIFDDFDGFDGFEETIMPISGRSTKVRQRI